MTTNLERYAFGFVLGVFLAFMALIGRTHPADLCHEDEVWWWVANDVRACVALDEVVP